MKTIVIALGGNALEEHGKPATAQNSLEVIRRTCAHIATIAEDGWRVALVHGNGPQVGRIVLQNELAADQTPAMPLDFCGAMSQGMIGYPLQQSLQEALAWRGLPARAVTLVTQVRVDGADPAFSAPTKPIGPFYTRAQAEALARERGCSVREDAGRGWRRVVASPEPLGILELDAVRALMEAGFLPICVGGGGIPVTRGTDGRLQGVAAVIDKDLAGERLAEDLKADVLLILTEVEQAFLDFGTPRQQGLSRLTAAEAETLMAQGHFAPGSMLPKVRAAARFAASGAGRAAVIAALDRASDALAGRCGTRVEG